MLSFSRPIKFQMLLGQVDYKSIFTLFYFPLQALLAIKKVLPGGKTQIVAGS